MASTGGGGIWVKMSKNCTIIANSTFLCSRGGGGVRAVRGVQALSGDFEHVQQDAHVNNIRHATMCDVYFSFSATLLKGLCAYT